MSGCKDNCYGDDGYSDAIYAGLFSLNRRADNSDSQRSVDKGDDRVVQLSGEINSQTDRPPVLQFEPQQTQDGQQLEQQVHRREQRYERELAQQQQQPELQYERLQGRHPEMQRRQEAELQEELQRDQAVILSLEHRLRFIQRRRKQQQRKLSEAIRKHLAAEVSGARRRNEASSSRTEALLMEVCDQLHGASLENVEKGRAAGAEKQNEQVDLQTI